MRLEIAPGILAEIPDEAAPEVLAEIKAQREVNPLVGYFPHPKQAEFHGSTGPGLIAALIGGNRSGKTEGTIADDVIQLLPEEWVPDHLKAYKVWQPPFYLWIGCPKYAKLEEAIFPKLRKLVPPSQFWHGSFDNAYSKQDKLLRLECGSTVGFKTYDQDVDAYSSMALHRMHWDEEPEGEHGKALRTEARARLIDFNGDETLSMTPLFGLSWVYDEIWERRDQPHITVVRADMDDNPHLSKVAQAAFLDGLTKEERRARKSGEFIHFKGLVFDEFKDDLHLVPQPEIEHVKGLDVVEGIDPGIRTTGIVICGFDRDNSMLIFDELYLHGEDAIPENAAKFLRAKRAAWGYDPMYTVIDPSARNRNLVTGQNIQDGYLNAGVPTIPGQNEVEAGIFEVKRRLQHRIGEKQRPLLHVSKNCTTWLWERSRYRMDDRVDGQFAVVKQDDHVMDPTRYVAMSRPIGPSPAAAGPTEHHWEPGMAPPAEWGNQTHEPTSPLGDL